MNVEGSKLFLPQSNSLVDEHHQRIHHELFDPARREDLILALLAPSPEIVTSLQVVAAEVDQVDDQEEVDDCQEVDQETVP